MPLKECSSDGKSGFKWGDSGTCYPHDGTDEGKAAAKKRAIKQAIAIGGGKMPNAAKHAEELSVEDVALVLEAAAEYAAESDELPTVTIERIPILSEGGPYFGTGSPKEGDFYTKAGLEKIAKANRELADQVKPPNKLGHSDKQKLLANSGMTEDELPAIGWLKGASFTVEKDETHKLWTLYADAVKVPAKIAKLLKSGGYRTRSVELSKIRDGDKTWPLVVTALAWLGAKAPAVRTLDDVFAMYAAGDVIWDPEAGFKDVMDDLRAQLAPPAGQPCRYWIEDVSRDLSSCIVRDWEQNKTWVAGVTMDGDEPTIAPANEWTLAEQAWVEANPADSYATAAREAYTEHVRKNGGAAADTEGMPETKQLSDEQVLALAKALNIDAEATEYSDFLRGKVEGHLRESLGETGGGEGGGGEGGSGGGTDGGAGDGGGTGGGGTTPPEPATVSMSADELAQLRTRAELGERAYTERVKERHDAILARALGRDSDTHKIDPADEAEWRKFLSENETLAVTALSHLPDLPNSRAYGADNVHVVVPEGKTVADVAQTGKQAWRDYAGATGVPVRETSAA